MTDAEMAHYSRALDTVYDQRVLLARAAVQLDQMLELKTFPASQRPAAEGLSAAMKQAARGEVDTAPAAATATADLSDQAALLRVGARGTLTRGSWEQTTTAGA